MTVTLDIGMGLLILAIFMFISNVLTVYFTFSTWYGKKKKDMVAFHVDEEGRYHFDFEDKK
jgi:hypothetical protein|tara:strand:+ start:58 stop:240 length:183 start_codon:yes stop_codon:yes gene_type:complete